MKAWKTFVAVFLISSPLLSQNQPVPVPTACGDLQVSMAVDLDNTQHSVTQPEPGTALIYFIQDTGQAVKAAYPTTKIGIDGKWVGANKKDSYFAVAVKPGDHHLCAAMQSSWARGGPELAQLTAEAGKIYYFRTRIILNPDNRSGYLSLTSTNDDEAKYLIESFSLAKAHARK